MPVFIFWACPQPLTQICSISVSKKTNALRQLDAFGVEYDIIHYVYDPAELNLERIAKDNQLEIANIFKTLILLTDTAEPLVALVAGDRTLSLKKLAALAACKKVELAPLDQIQRITGGYQRGGCSPLGMRRNLPTFVDAHALDFEKIYVNAGIRGTLFGCAPTELMRAMQDFAQIAVLSEK